MRSRLPEWSLVFVTFIWGSTFISGQIALREIGVFGFLSVRFAIGAAVLALIGARRLRRLTAEELKAGLAIGLVLFVAYSLQALGLPRITSSKSAFITSVYVPLVPALQLLVTGRSPSIKTLLGTALSFAGLVLLSARQGMTLSFGIGEWLTLGSAVASAAQIVMIGKLARGADPVRLGVVQLSLVALLALCTMPFAQEAFPVFSGRLVGISLGMGVLATALSLATMNWAQQTVSAARATLIYAMEPVWAGMIGIVIGEQMPPAAMAGAGLIVAGMLLSGLKMPRLRAARA
ncbi:MAG TPA: DMT family transporter [Fimbriimonadaceae bacterium]|nr:DMT family transporter [Fimbriimonadaceae bacterium]